MPVQPNTMQARISQTRTAPARLLTAAMSTFLLAVIVAAPLWISPPAAAEENAEIVLNSGNWTKKSFKAEGTWSIVEIGDKRFVRLSEDFSTKRAPDLKIFLSPSTAGDASNKNATKGSILVSELTSNSGAQEYALPDGLDLSAYKSILIHCEQYSKLWSAADL